MRLSEYIYMTEDRLDFLRKKYEAVLNKTQNDETFMGAPVGVGIFNTILKADPTNNHMYTEWLILLYLNGNLRLNEDDYKAREYLTIYHQIKHKLPLEQRQINQIKSLPDLFKIVEPYTEKIKQQYNAKINEKMRTESNVLLDNNVVMVVVPATMEASCYFGSGTQWCTANLDNEHNYFEKYRNMGDGELYIIIFKGSDEKYQLFFDPEHFDSSIEFMDKDDNDVEKNLLTILERDKELYELFQSLFRDKQYVRGMTDINESEAMELVYYNGLSLEYIPEEIRTEKVINLAVMQNGMALQFVPEGMKSEQIVALAVEETGSALEFVDKEMITVKLAIMAVKSDPQALEYVPETIQNYEIYFEMVKAHGYALQFVPKKLITTELAMMAVTNNPTTMSSVPERLRTPELMRAADR